MIGMGGRLKPVFKTICTAAMLWCANAPGQSAGKPRVVVTTDPELDDSNSLIRFKLALTEDEAPTIKPYYEDRWAELGDSKLPVAVSLKLIDTLHARWVALLESMTDADFAKTFIHPETGEWTLDGALALYAWHSRHHTAHITRLREREGW